MIRTLGAVLIVASLGCVSSAKAASINVKCATNEDRVWVYESVVDFNLAAKLKCGEPVEIIGRIKGYVKVQTQAGVEGYVADSAFPKSALPPEPEEKPNDVESASVAALAHHSAAPSVDHPNVSAAPAVASAAPARSSASSSGSSVPASSANVAATNVEVSPVVSRPQPPAVAPRPEPQPVVVANTAPAVPAAPAVSVAPVSPRPQPPVVAPAPKTQPVIVASALPTPAPAPAAASQPAEVEITLSTAPTAAAPSPAPVAPSAPAVAVSAPSVTIPQPTPTPRPASAPSSSYVANASSVTVGPNVSAAPSPTIQPVSDSVARPPAPVANPDEDEDTSVRALENENAGCTHFFSAYGLSPNQYKWLAQNRKKAFPSICPAPTPSMVDFVVIFTHDVAFYNATMPTAVHVDHNGFSDWTPMSTVDTALMNQSEANSSHHEYVWVFHTNRGAFDPAKFSPRRKPLFSKGETNMLGSHGGYKTVMDALTYIESNGTNR
jgi:hypothetical protein